VGAEDH